MPLTCSTKPSSRESRSAGERGDGGHDHRRGHPRLRGGGLSSQTERRRPKHHRDDPDRERDPVREHRGSGQAGHQPYPTAHVARAAADLPRSRTPAQTRTRPTSEMLTCVLTRAQVRSAPGNAFMGEGTPVRRSESGATTGTSLAERWFETPEWHYSTLTRIREELTLHAFPEASRGRSALSAATE